MKTLDSTRLIPTLLTLWLSWLAGGLQAQNLPVPAGASLPPWAAIKPPDLPVNAPSLHSKDLELIHAPDNLGHLLIKVAGQPMAIGWNNPMVGYMSGTGLNWLDLQNARNRTVRVTKARNSLRVKLNCVDSDGGHWQIEQKFTAIPAAAAIDVTTELKVDRDRVVAFLPMLVIFPGAGSFGSSKGQGLFAGLEYLENEPSSSEADVIGPASKRQVPDNLKITFPLMAIEAGGRYVALTWQPQPCVSAMFDSPDRQFNSGGHVMGLLFPGSDGKNRVEGSLLPRTAELLRSNQPIVLHATILGGVGDSVVPAIEQYVSMRGLPDLPVSKIDRSDYVSLASHGWLDSQIREGHLFRHAVWPKSFGPGQAADAALWMDWLAGQTQDAALAIRLTNSAKDALAPIPPDNFNYAGVGHVRYPAVSLVYGRVSESAARSEQVGRGLLGRFESDGSIRYHPDAGGPDYGKTHFTNEATGLTARPVAELLEAAAFSGSRELIDAGLNRLRALDKFRHGVPRGAQTWECPLHTPDILASAYLVRAYTLGYELTGDPDLLIQAKYWAWTGVPFVYLTDPTPQAVGRYSTIAVFGATNWKAPVWLGLPVQWCGLVYADALYRLDRHDPDGPWKRLADGITISGIQQTWPVSDAARQGLLPDSFVLRAQQRSGPAINPATVQACAAQLFGRPAYDFWAFRQSGWCVHAPGAIKQAKESNRWVRFEMDPWVKHPCFILVNGLTHLPKIKINGKPAVLASPSQFQSAEGRLILQLEGKARIEIASD